MDEENYRNQHAVMEGTLESVIYDARSPVGNLAASKPNSTPPAAQPRALIRVTSAIARVFLPLVSRFLAHFFELDRRIWIFGFQDMQGIHEFVENSKYMFLEASNASKVSIRPVWISWSSRLAVMLANEGYEAYWVMSARGLKLVLQAGCVFSHIGCGGILQDLVGCGRALKVELWHGIPLKSLDVPVHADYVVATSELLRNTFAKALRVHSSHVIVSGYPRDDALLKTVRGYEIGVAETLDAVLRLKSSGRIVLYAPTFRDNLIATPEEFLRYLCFDKHEVDDLLRRHDAYMIMKFHRLVRSAGENYELEKISERIYSINDPIDLYAILPQADILLTDYSSVFFDFLLLDRPIVFYVPDYEKYIRERGFCFDFESFTPGPKARSLEELVLALQDALLKTDRYTKQRQKVRAQVFDYFDGLSSSRIVESVKEILNLDERGDTRRSADGLHASKLMLKL